MITYFRQLEWQAERMGVTLDQVCARVGIAQTTLFRWRRGDHTCREDKAQALMDEMAVMAIEIDDAGESDEAA